MATKVMDGRNPDKTKLQAQTSKEKVAIAKAAQTAEWQRKLQREGRKIDRALEDASKLAKKIGETMKKGEDTKKMLEDLGDIILGTLKEMQSYTSVPDAGSLPKAPANTVALGTMLPVLMAAVIWWKKVKGKLR